MKKKLNKKQITVILLGVILVIVIVAGSVTAVLMLNSWTVNTMVSVRDMAVISP